MPQWTHAPQETCSEAWGRKCWRAEADDQPTPPPPLLMLKAEQG